MRVILPLLLFWIGSVQLLAQQPAQYTLYMLDPLRWNPAYAGLDHSLSVTGLYRRQWVGLEGGPTSQRLSAHLPLYALQGGFGVQVQNDALGANRRTSGWLNYNYQLQLGNGILSLGGGLGFIQWGLDGNRLRTPSGRYTEPGVVDHQDGVLPIATETGQVVTYSAGVYYQSERLEVGFSAEHLTQPSIALRSYTYALSRAYYAGATLHLELGSAWSVHPSAWVRTDAVQTQTDLSVLFRYNENLFVGPALRGYNANSIDALALIGGLRINDHLTIAYGYDLTLSALQNVQSGSHEVGLRYNLNKPIGLGVPPPIIYHPRARF